MNRKKFITSATLISVASLGGSLLINAAVRKTRKSFPIIDTHQHLWDIERFSEGWSVPPLPGNFGIRDYLIAIQGLNVVKSVYMEVGVPPDKRHEEALYAIELCKNKSYPTVAAVIAVDPNLKDFEAYLLEFKNSPYVKGIRYFFKSPEEILNERVIKNIRSLGGMNMSFDFSIPPGWLPNMTELVSLCPGTRFIVNHCGNADPKAFFKPEEFFGKPDHDREQWITDMKAIASKKNVVCKISGIVTRAPGYKLTSDNLAPAINHCLDIFGPDRVMFASDWPVCLVRMEMRSWVNILKKIVVNKSYEDQKKLFHDNAVKFYAI